MSHYSYRSCLSSSFVLFLMANIPANSAVLCLSQFPWSVPSCVCVWRPLQFPLNINTPFVYSSPLIHHFSFMHSLPLSRLSWFCTSSNELNTQQRGPFSSSVVIFVFVLFYVVYHGHFFIFWPLFVTKMYTLSVFVCVLFAGWEGGESSVVHHCHPDWTCHSCHGAQLLCK